ncbi:MAG TPA: trypsin-like peptidase domain-containing protein [Micromonosporaceae bacterium]|nr:trypsin-like peptidase domain-containing protein [Micromonosporaceae bacterium]
MSENQAPRAEHDATRTAELPLGQPPAPHTAPPAAPAPPRVFPAAAPLPGPVAPPVFPATGPASGPRPGRVGRGLALGAAALVLSLGSALVGGYAATRWDDDTPVTASERTVAAAPVVDRSSLAVIAAAVQPSVVSVATGSGEGSGVVLSGDGYVLTNNHVVADARGGALTVTFSDGKRASASVVGTDPKTDLAVVKASVATGLTPAKFGDSDAMRVGDTVLALGSPLGLEGSVTAGIVSATNRTIQAGGQGSPLGRSAASTISGVIQTDAAINPGNSGGALVNLGGEVIGINTAIATAGNGNGNIGVGFAIPGNRAKQVAEALAKGQKVSHPYLGVQVSTAAGGGALVGAVTEGSPAEQAGLQRGDVITKIADSTVADSDDLVSAVQSGKVGDRLELTYTRDGAVRTTTVTLAEAS